MAEMITEPTTPEQPQEPDDRIYVGLDGIQVAFPAGFWEDPSQDLIYRGRPRREWFIDNLALTIAQGLRQALKQRHVSAGLVGPDGRPIAS